MNKIYIVYGESGDYDDYVKWSVYAFSTQKKAQQYKNLCPAYYNLELQK